MKLRTLLCVILALAASPAYALLSIDITHGNVDPIPIALPMLASSAGEGQGIGRDVTSVVAGDLEGSGLFRPIDDQSFIQDIQGSETMPEFSYWRKINATALLTGGVKMASAAEFNTEFRLWDVYAGQQVGWAIVGGVFRASLWSGTAVSWEDLSMALTGSWGDTEASSIWSEGSTIYIAGNGFNNTSGRGEALIWTTPVPAPGAGALLGLGGLVFTRRRR